MHTKLACRTWLAGQTSAQGVREWFATLDDAAAYGRRMGALGYLWVVEYVQCEGRWALSI